MYANYIYTTSRQHGSASVEQVNQSPQKVCVY